MHPASARLAVLTVLLLLTACGQSFDATTATEAQPRTTSAWPEYGGGTGQRFVAATDIDRANVGDLQVAWIYRTGDVSAEPTETVHSTSAFELTPILAEGRLVLCTPFNDVIALDPLTGGELWRYRHHLDLSGNYDNQMVCRGVSYWPGSAGDAPGACATRILTATNDGYLVALDTATGKPCADFGADGRVNLKQGVGGQDYLGEYQQTSPPAVVGDRVLVGAAIGDNRRLDAPSGVIRAYDVRTGAQVWAFDLAPPGYDYAHDLVSDEGFALGTPNVWGPMTVDPASGWVYVPTGNPSPDYYRTGEPDMDYYGTSVVALDGATGEVQWHFNTVMNDFWDYDVASQPTLADLQIHGETVPALIQGTKMGFVFVLDRRTGVPVVPVRYESVPREGPLASQLSPMQPFPPPAFRLSPEVTADQAWGLTPIDEGACRELLESSRTGPIYTPVTEEWTVVAPSNIGGINWGGVAVDAARGRIYARSSNVPYLVKLIPKASFHGREGYEWDVELAEQRGLPFAMARRPLLSDWGLPCNEPPWGYLTAIDIDSESQVWRVAHGTVRDIAPVPLPLALGVPGLGAPIVTATGLVFIGAAWENVLRAYDADTGEELWKTDLPASPQATPMSYTVTRDDGSEKQFVVIAAGGHGRMGSTMGDYLVAFALPD
ncbi:MAG: pyrroloquinoline quinone-dependent dehydrogenase [Pseudomonadales bacterium]|jgi:quinoprotein glucose dehydrogenase